jgi:hypothetical protein
MKAGEVFRKHRNVLQQAGWVWNESELYAALQSVDTDRLEAAAELLDCWLSRDGAGFIELLTGPFVEVRDAPALLPKVLALKHDFLLLALANPAIGSAREIGDIARPLFKSDVMLGSRLIRRLIDGIPSCSFTFSDAMVERGLDILYAVDALDRLSIYLVQMLQHSNRRIRSKAALLLAPSSRNTTLLLDRYNRAPDARVRANLIEGLWSVEATGKSELLWKATKDTNHRVVANALLGLYRLGDPEAVTRLTMLAGDPKPERRGAAAWAMGRTADPRFAEILQKLFRADQGSPRRNALRALVQLRRKSEQAA